MEALFECEPLWFCTYYPKYYKHMGRIRQTANPTRRLTGIMKAIINDGGRVNLKSMIQHIYQELPARVQNTARHKTLIAELNEVST